MTTDLVLTDCDFAMTQHVILNQPFDSEMNVRSFSILTDWNPKKF